MDAIFVGIDVLKDRLDVAVRPNGESFSVSRTGAGIGELVERLKTMSPRLVAIEATGGFETVVAAGFAEATKPQVRQLPDETTQMLADLVARRRQIVEMIVAEASAHAASPANV